MIKTNTIICGDALEELKKMPDECIDLVITSPPYNMLQKRAPTKNSTFYWKNPTLLREGYTNHQDNMSDEEYTKWQRECLTEMMRVLKKTGAVFYNHKWKIKGGLLDTHQEIIKDLPLRQIIIWNRQAMIDFSDTYFGRKYEVIYIFAKPNFKLSGKSTNLGDVWTILAERNNPHPASFPVELPDRIISSTDAEVILDPFCGSGTTLVSALNFDRKYIGIDNSPEYCKMAERRIKRFIKQK